MRKCNKCGKPVYKDKTYSCPACLRKKYNDTKFLGKDITQGLCLNCASLRLDSFWCVQHKKQHNEKKVCCYMMEKSDYKSPLSKEAQRFLKVSRTSGGRF